MNVREPKVRRWWPLVLAGILVVAAVLYLAPLQGLLLVGLWLLCPLLMLGMHASSRRHGPQH
jgi:hypothetical protein